MREKSLNVIHVVKPIKAFWVWKLTQKLLIKEKNCLVVIVVQRNTRIKVKNFVEQCFAFLAHPFLFNCLLVCKKGFLCSCPFLSIWEEMSLFFSNSFFFFQNKILYKRLPKKFPMSTKNLVKLPYSAQKLLLRAWSLTLFFVLNYNSLLM